VKPYGLLFPGQLFERPGMGAPLRGEEGFERLVPRFDDLTRGQFGRWVTEAPAEEISERFTAPRLMVLFGCAAAETARVRLGPPAAAAGYSLGFYAASVFARCVALEPVLKWLDRVNESNACRFPPGSFALASVTGLTEGEVREAFSAEGLKGLEVANVNSARQVVIAGPSPEVEAAMRSLGGRALECRRLPLDVPLHTPYVEAAREAVSGWWGSVPASSPTLLLPSPVDGAPVRSGEAFKRHMLESLVSPTRWDLVVGTLAANGVTRLVDLSPGGELGRASRWVCREAEVIPLGSLLDGGP
jgi:[acyl-carrier-protein] S-malonyltransferase